MTATQIATLAVMAAFYASYTAKGISQKKQGVKTMILGEGEKPASQKRIETALKAVSFAIPAVEIASILLNLMEHPTWVQWTGIAVAALGVAFFIASMTTMKGSWRAGIPEKKETSLVTNGIFRISRNPAFVGFDLMYIGILIAFPNIWHALFATLTVAIFHLQILNEEKFLEGAFGQEYLDYKKSVRRYL